MSRPVYSTDGGNLCRNCGNALSTYSCKPGRCKQPKTISTDGIVRLQRQTKGRNGKPVVLIIGIPLQLPELKTLASKLKAKCGVGGSVDDGSIIIQGDKRETLKRELELLGYKVKLSGG
jgi:translation initiation factor 1